MTTPSLTRFRPRWLIIALIVLLVLLMPFLLLGIASDSDQTGPFFSYSTSSTIRDEEGNIIEHYVNGIPATPQPPEPDRCGNNEDEFIPGNENPDESVLSISIGCWKLFERKQTE